MGLEPVAGPGSLRKESGSRAKAEFFFVTETNILIVQRACSSSSCEVSRVIFSEIHRRSDRLSRAGRSDRDHRP